MEAEMKAKARWVAEAMNTDGITKEMVADMPDANKIALIMSYMDSIGKKIEDIQAQCLVHPKCTKAIGDFLMI